MHEGRMATGTGEGGGHTALENTTATALTESSSSSSSSSVPTILTDSTNNAVDLPLTGPQQQSLHQVQQQQAQQPQQQQQQQHQQQQSHSRPRVNLVTDLPANDASVRARYFYSTVFTSRLRRVHVRLVSELVVLKKERKKKTHTHTPCEPLRNTVPTGDPRVSGNNVATVSGRRGPSWRGNSRGPGCSVSRV
ncbi:uncharacterized protein LOC143373110 isoform X1 [Andrena cerasifolii]|uniref:uncharacterized protein LOC143373110 isoform X1 n=1 Tax=Andrena cerasifolii TaxID=2819439 RepID=UPI0040381CA0